MKRSQSCKPFGKFKKKKKKQTAFANREVKKFNLALNSAFCQNLC